MAAYYLTSQLPSLDGLGENMPIPITEERFTELCNRFLKPKNQTAMKKLTLSPPRKYEASSSSLIDAWNESERNLRFALGKVRAEKMNKTFDTENRILPVEHIKAASTAIEMDNPKEAEKYLNHYRLSVLDALKPLDIFSEDYIFYYGLKLKLLLRMKNFNEDAGEKAYRSIYHSILNDDRSEVKQ